MDTNEKPDAANARPSSDDFSDVQPSTRTAQNPSENGAVHAAPSDNEPASNGLKSAALSYAAHGLPVFPCVPGEKRPLTKHGFMDATTDVAQICRWWDEHPTANVAVATGSAGWVVADVDPRNGGDETFDVLRSELGPGSFDTVTAITPSGGQHLIYGSRAVPVKSGNNALGQGIDIKADGGYILVAPSVVNGNTYTWEVGYSPLDREPQPWPESLNSKIVRKAAHRASDENEPILGGDRNDWLASIAGTMRRRGFSGEAIFAALKVTNLERCTPPLEESEVRSVAYGMNRYPPEEGKKRTVHWEDARPWPVLQEAALYGLAGDIVRVLGPHTEADPAAILATTMGMFGNAAGRADGTSPFVRRGSVQHPPRLFALISGATAKSRKGQSYSDVSLLLSVADRECLNTTALSGLSTGEGLIHHLRDKKPDFHSDDENHIEPATEKRAMVHEAEFSRVLAAASRKESTLSAILRDAWDKKPLRVLTRKDPLEAKNAHISIVAHITQDELIAKTSDLDIANGMLNRFVIVAVKRSKVLPNGGRLSTDEVVKLGNRIKLLLDRARSISEVTLSPAAEEAWGHIYCTGFSEEAGLVGSIVARGDAQTLRMALIYALMDESTYGFDGGPFQIQQEHIRAAYAFWQYIEASTRHIFGARLGNVKADRLLNALRDVFPEGLDFTAQRDLFKHHASEKELNDIRAVLDSRGLIRTETVETGGRPKTISYAIPPGDKSDETSMA